MDNPNNKPLLKIIPWGLIVFRLILGPVLILQTKDGSTNLWFVFWIFMALLSDILDGVIARYFKVASAPLRTADSVVDFIFIIYIAASAWVGYQTQLRNFSIPILILMVTLYAISIMYPWLKFAQVPAYHAYSAKLAGIAMTIAAIGLFGFGFTGGH